MDQVSADTDGNKILETSETNNDNCDMAEPPASELSQSEDVSSIDEAALLESSRSGTQDTQEELDEDSLLAEEGTESGTGDDNNDDNVKERTAVDVEEKLDLADSSTFERPAGFQALQETFIDDVSEPEGVKEDEDSRVTDVKEESKENVDKDDNVDENETVDNPADEEANRDQTGEIIVDREKETNIGDTINHSEDSQSNDGVVINDAVADDSSGRASSLGVMSEQATQLEDISDDLQSRELTPEEEDAGEAKVQADENDSVADNTGLNAVNVDNAKVDAETAMETVEKQVVEDMETNPQVSVAVGAADSVGMETSEDVEESTETDKPVEAESMDIDEDKQSTEASVTDEKKDTDLEDGHQSEIPEKVEIKQERDTDGDKADRRECITINSGNIKQEVTSEPVHTQTATNGDADMASKSAENVKEETKTEESTVEGENSEMCLKIVGVTSAVGMEDTREENKDEEQVMDKNTDICKDDSGLVVIDDDDEKKEADDRKEDGSLGIQISAVSGGVDMIKEEKKEEKEQLVPEEKIKAETKVEDSKQTSTADDDDVIAIKEEKPPVQKQTAQKSTTSKIQKCIVCQKIGKCKYNIVRNGDIKHLCDDSCFKQFRSNPTTYLRQTDQVKQTTNGTQTTTSTTTTTPASSNNSQNSSSQAFKTCSVCQLMNIRTSKPFLNWQGLDFCGEECLGKFQGGLSSLCCYCGAKIPQHLRAKFCYKVDADIKQFCSSSCHTDYGKRLKLCAFCNRDLKVVADSFMAPVGNQGTFKDFCSQSCLLKYEEKNNREIEIVGIQKGVKAPVAPKGNFQCAVCSKVGPVKHEFKLEGKLNRLCGDPCFLAFQYANKLTMSNCDNCGSYCYNEGRQPQFIQFEGHQKRFCSFMCVNTFRELNKKTVACAWCGSKKGNFDMIERVDANNKYQLFCSLNCLSLYRVNLQATSNQAVMCDQCRKVVPAQYHLTMSDASVRNFCSYSCVMTFQSQFAQPSKSAQKSPVSAPSQPPPTQTTRSGRPVTRGVTQQQKQVTPPPKTKTNQKQQQSPGSFPIISNVVSLAPQGTQQQINLKTPANVPVVVTGQQNIKTSTTTTGNQTVQQQIIIQPPPPKSVKNKSLICKPFVQTKATSCRPHTQVKSCQTEGEFFEKKHHFIPVPVPIYIPTPLAMYTTPTPVPVAIPIPVPVPIFIPTTKKSSASILKQIKEIQEKIPADPLEAELLMMAEAVAGKEEESESDADDDLETQPPAANLPGEATLTQEASTTAPAAAGGDLGEDMLQMALRMASEMSNEPVMDLETSLEPVAVNTVPPPVQDRDVVEDEEVYIAPKNLRRSSKKRTSSGRTTRRSSKRQKVENTVEPDPQETSTQLQSAPPPDANFHLKFTYGVNAWKHWVIQKNSQLEQASKHGSGKPLKTFKTDLLQCTADELNFSLCLFVKEVRKPNGEEYAVDSIYYLCLGIQQYLFENGRIDNIFTDVYYEKFTECLNEILQRYEPKLNTSGQLVCRIEEEHLWESKQLGAHSPHVLLNSLVYFNTKYFMLKTSEDHLKLSFTHIMKHWKKTASGRGSGTGVNAGRSVYLRYFTPGSQGADANQQNKKKKEEFPVYEQSENLDNPLRCPVKLYEFYLSKCPESTKNRNDAFYLVPERSCVPDSPVWYSTQMMGIDHMAKMLNRIRLVREIQEAHLHTQPVYI